MMLSKFNNLLLHNNLFVLMMVQGFAEIWQLAMILVKFFIVE